MQRSRFNKSLDETRSTIWKTKSDRFSISNNSSLNIRRVESVYGANSIVRKPWLFTSSSIPNLGSRAAKCKVRSFTSAYVESLIKETSSCTREPSVTEVSNKLEDTATSVNSTQDTPFKKILYSQI